MKRQWLAFKLLVEHHLVGHVLLQDEQRGHHNLPSRTHHKRIEITAPSRFAWIDPVDVHV
jgi:hypothetical protein